MRLLAGTLVLAALVCVGVGAARAPIADPPIPGHTLSLGVAQADPERGYDIDNLSARADAAL